MNSIAPHYSLPSPVRVPLQVPEPCGGLPVGGVTLPVSLSAILAVWFALANDKHHIQMEALRGIASPRHFCFPSAIREQHVPIFFLRWRKHVEESCHVIWLRSTGLAKKFIRVFPLHLMEKPGWTFWLTQCILVVISYRDLDLWEQLRTPGLL